MRRLFGFGLLIGLGDGDLAAAGQKLDVVITHQRKETVDLEFVARNFDGEGFFGQIDYGGP